MSSLTVIFFSFKKETSVLRSNLLRHDNLVKYAEHLKAELELNSTPSLTSPSSSSKDSSAPSASRRKASSGWGKS
jgi:hypothetical protein